MINSLTYNKSINPDFEDISRVELSFNIVNNDDISKQIQDALIQVLEVAFLFPVQKFEPNQLDTYRSFLSSLQLEDI